MLHNILHHSTVVKRYKLAPSLAVIAKVFKPSAGIIFPWRLQASGSPTREIEAHRAVTVSRKAISSTATASFHIVITIFRVPERLSYRFWGPRSGPYVRSAHILLGEFSGAALSKMVR
jgi:hypothetical protein